MRPAWPALALVAVLAACTSPEATRMRAGGPGGDTGNRGESVEMHAGSEPYWRTPQRLADQVVRPAGETAASASPR
jgi:hypothetical protein